MPLTKRFLYDYPNPVFIETGTFLGYGITHAIEAGFPKIYSIELSEYYYMRAVKGFCDFPNVHLIFGDSGTELGKLLKDINKPVTFWLDAHYSEQNTAGEGFTPLMKELEAITSHHIKTHIILIDDIYDYDIDEIKRLTGYDKFTLVNNILICQR